LFLVGVVVFPAQTQAATELIRPYATADRVILNTALVFTVLYAANKK
jgi:hypothetical protein